MPQNWKAVHSFFPKKEKNLHPTPSVSTQMALDKRVTCLKYHTTKKPEHKKMFPCFSKTWDEIKSTDLISWIIRLKLLKCLSGQILNTKSKADLNYACSRRKDLQKRRVFILSMNLSWQNTLRKWSEPLCKKIKKRLIQTLQKTENSSSIFH